jgi:hydrogenase/urease accessory protein HupE
MRFWTAAFAVVALALSRGDAHAHDFIAGAGFANGFLHPLLVPSHALCLLAFGLMTGQQDRPHRVFLVTLFPVILIAGILMIVAAYSLTVAQTLLLACGGAAGLLTAFAQPLPRIVSASILAIGGLSLIFDSVPSVVSRLDSVLALSGTAFGAILALVLAAYAAASLTRDWQRIGIRILGSWTAASALLVLALRLVK